jgi:hypothetical protein
MSGASRAGLSGQSRVTGRFGTVWVGSQTLETAITPSRRRRINPRLLAPMAFLIAFTAIALVIVYSVGHFFTETAQQIH